MSVSIYYSARRRAALNAAEILQVAEVVRQHSVDEQIQDFLRTGSGLNWESFYYMLNSEPGGLFKKHVVFSGSTRLPDNREDAAWLGVQHWCACLSELRRTLAHCDWSVFVEDRAVHWDAKTRAYDPSI